MNTAFCIFDKRLFIRVIWAIFQLPCDLFPCFDFVFTYLRHFFRSAHAYSAVPATPLSPGFDIIYRDLYILLDSRTRTAIRELDLKFFSRILNTPESFIVLCFTRKINAVVVNEGRWALSRWQNHKTSSIWHLVSATTTILAKTRSRMTTAIAFCRQNDTSLRARAQKRFSS